ncbi:MAG: site-specific integrase [Microcoleus sp.]
MGIQRKARSACDITIGVDHGSLRLQFPSRHKPALEVVLCRSLEGKPNYLPLGKHGFGDNPEDKKRALQIAIAMEADLDHPEWDKLFDPTLAKYGIGSAKYAQLAQVLQMPGTKQPEPEMTVGAMWEDYLVWKETQIEASTFKAKFSGTYSNVLKGLKWCNKTKKFSDTGNGIWDELLSAEIGERISLIELHLKTKSNLIGVLNEAFTRAQSQGKVGLVKNPFSNLKLDKPDTRDKYKSVVMSDGTVWKWWEVRNAKNQDALEDDKRAFTAQERDVIIRAFYESDKSNERQIAPLIEFLFLTGCRPGEAFALVWDNVKLDNNCVVFQVSYSTTIKDVKVTKNDSIRLFYLYPRLTALLERIKPDDAKGNDLVFKAEDGGGYNSNLHGQRWLGNSVTAKGKTYHYPGVVTRLIEEGKLVQYLPPYHARHTYITLTAWANRENPNALVLLAASCENSVEVILKHYMDVDHSTRLIQV